MQFRVLGPLEVRATDGALVQLGAPKHRALLGVLLLSANRWVSADVLVDTLWPRQPPPSAMGALRTYVSALRRALGLDRPGHASRLTGRPGGYRLAVTPADLDLLLFEDLADRAQQARDTGDVAATADLTQQALALWRGRALEDVPLEGAAPERVRQLDERRLTVLSASFEARLALGQHAELLPELGALVTAYPLREDLHGQWMLALYRSGRQADALAAYRTLRSRLVEELGVEPGAPAQRLHQRILTGDPELNPPPPVSATAVPRQLPPDVAFFTGRPAELDTLDALLRPAAGHGPVPICAIDGIGGVGKSALAVHAAHRVAGRFPDGQLYADLRGATAGPSPATSLTVLGQFLAALGVRGRNVGTVEEATAQFRAVTGTRRILVVLDNARDAAQVRPLLPASPSCAVLVTSRQVLATLDSATHLHLDVLSPAESVTLLARIVGGPRITADSEAAEQVARFSGYLPLALRIAGARLAARPGWPTRTLAGRLTDTWHRLDELQVADLGVRASFGVSHDALRHSADPADRAAAAAFALLGLPDGPDLSVPATARLIDRDEAATEAILERLVDNQLVDSPAPARYRLHDLLRLFARELAAAEHPPQARTAALTRLFGWYLAGAAHAFRLLRPGQQRPWLGAREPVDGGPPMATAAEAMDWLEAERGNVVAAVHQAAVTSGVPPDIPTRTAAALFAYFPVRGHWEEWIRLNVTALAVGRSVGDRAAEATARFGLGVAEEIRGRYAEALTHLNAALDIFDELGDRHGRASCLNSRSVVHLRQGRLDKALGCLGASLATWRELGARYDEGMSLNNMCSVLRRLGRHDEAVVAGRESLAVFADLGEQRGQAAAMTNLALAYDGVAEHGEALRCNRESLAVLRRLGDRMGQASALNNLGRTYRQMGDLDAAVACQAESGSLFRQLGEARGEAEALTELGRAYLALGRREEARRHWTRALTSLDRLGVPDADDVRALLKQTEV